MGFFGLAVATVAGVISYFFDSGVLGEAFLDATTVLFWWYIASGILGIVPTLLVIMGLTSGAAILGAEKFGSRGGAAAGAGARILISLVVLVGMSVAGAYLLQGAVELIDGAYVWQIPQAIIGAVLIGFSIAVTNARSSK